MSGHSKWHNIRERKTAVSASRGKVFMRYARLIEIAAREGGGDPDANPRLRHLVDAARSENVPHVNIERAVKKGTGELKGEAPSIEVVYEAFGPAGTAYLIECLTDNRNRTVANVKHLLHRHDGRFAENGAVSWMFEQRGCVVAEGGEKSKEECELLAIDHGADAITWQDHTMEVVTGKTAWPKLRDALRAAGCMITSAGLRFVPTQPVAVRDPEIAERIRNLLRALEEDDDVYAVHTNTVMSNEQGLVESDDLYRMPQGGGNSRA